MSEWDKSEADVPVAIPATMWFAALLITLQSLSFGFVFSCLNSCLVTGDNNEGSDCYHGTDSSCPEGSIYNDMNLTTVEAQMATSLTILGAWIGCIMGSSPSQKYGKRLVLLWNNLFFIVGAALSATGNFYLLFVGRFISGLGVGVSSGIPSVLLAEIATPETRGKLTTLHQVMITLGIFVAALTGYGFVTYVNHGWQYIQGFGALPGIAQLLLQSYMPESPKWLMMHDPSERRRSIAASESHMVRNTLHHQDEEVQEAEEAETFNEKPSSGERRTSSRTSNDSSKGHHMYDVVSEMLVPLRPPGHDIHGEIRQVITQARKEAAEAEQHEVTWGEVFSYKKGMTVGLGLMLFQALTGINSVTFYSGTIFGLAGFSESIIGTASFGAVNLIVTILTSSLIDKVGRKILLLTGTYIMLFALIVLSVVLISPLPDESQGLVAVLAVLVFVAGFALGLGAVVWAIMSEIMPNRVRIKAVSLFLSLNWGCNLIVGLLTLTAIDELGGVTSSMDDDDEIADREKMGVSYLYFVFAAITFAGIVFMHGYVPETKGKTPEQLAEWGAVDSPLLLNTDSGPDCNNSKEKELGASIQAD